MVGKSYIADLLEMLGEYVDGVKFAGRAFALMPHRLVRDFNDVVHRAGAYVSTGGWIEHVIARARSGNVGRYFAEAQTRSRAVRFIKRNETEQPWHEADHDCGECTREIVVSEGQRAIRSNHHRHDH